MRRTRAVTVECWNRLRDYALVAAELGIKRTTLWKRLSMARLAGEELLPSLHGDHRSAPALRASASARMKARWQDPAFREGQLAKLAACSRARGMTPEEKAYSRRRVLFLQKLARESDMTDAERFAAADKYFPRLAPRASEAGASPAVAGGTPRPLRSSPTNSPGASASGISFAGD